MGFFLMLAEQAISSNYHFPGIYYEFLLTLQTENVKVLSS